MNQFPHAACAGLGHLMFPTEDMLVADSNGRETAGILWNPQPGLNLCHTCPHIDACHKDAQTAHTDFPNGITGIWGGQDWTPRP
jgi:hypothetical protein